MTRHTRTSLCVCAVVTLAILTTRAASAATFYIEQKLTNSGVMGQPETTTNNKLWLSDTAIRTEDGDQVTIVRSDVAKVYIIQPAAKTYSELSLEQIKALSSMGAAMLGSKGGTPKATVVETEITRKVAGYDARKVIVTVDGPMPIEMTLWLTKEIDVNMDAWLSLAGGMGMQGLMGDAMEKIAKLGGYPLVQVTKTTIAGSAMTVIQEVTKIEERKVDPSLFELPKGYKLIEGLPGMPGTAVEK